MPLAAGGGASAVKALKPKLPEIYYVPPHLAVPFTEEEIAAYIEVGLAIILQRCPPPTTRHPPPR